MITLFLAHDFMRVKVLLDSGVEKNQKLIGVISSTLSPIKRQVVFELGLHAISSNDYVFAFLIKEEFVLESDVKATRIYQRLRKAWNKRQLQCR